MGSPGCPGAGASRADTSSGATSGLIARRAERQHARKDVLAIEQLMLERPEHVQRHDGEQRVVERDVHVAQDVLERVVGADQRGQR